MTSCITDLRVFHSLLRVPRRLCRVLRRRKSSRGQGSTRVRYLHQQTLDSTSLSASVSSSSSRKTEGLLTQEHLEPIISRKWKSVLAWITFSTHELSWTDKNKQTALHHACLFRAPLDVIELMLHQAPEMAKVANSEGEIPLHWAIRLSASTEVIRLLLSVYPSSAVDVQDASGNTALSLIWERHQHACLQAWWHEGAAISVGTLHSADQRNNQRLLLTTMRAWNQMMFFIKSKSNDKGAGDGRHRQPESSGSSLELHSASICACPPALYPLLVRVYAHQLLLVDPVRGKTPLELACSDPIANRSHDVQTKIQVLLSMIMTSTQILQRDRVSCLKLALRSGIMWEEGVKDLVHFCNVLDAQQQAPACGIHCQDHLDDDNDDELPLVIHAAMGSHMRARLVQECQTLSDDRSLDTIYLTLRMDPTQIKSVSSACV